MHGLKVVLVLLPRVSSRRSERQQNLLQWQGGLQTDSTAQGNIAHFRHHPLVKLVVVAQRQGKAQASRSRSSAFNGHYKVWSEWEIKPQGSIKPSMPGHRPKAAWCCWRPAAGSRERGPVVAAGAVPAGEGRPVRRSRTGKWQALVTVNRLSSLLNVKVAI